MIFTLVFLIPVLGFWAYKMTVLHSVDNERYAKMVEKLEIASTHSDQPTNQDRKQVRKDIWFSQDDSSRLHYQIASESSQLTLTPIKNRFEIVETLDGIKCWMQDKLMKEGAEEDPVQQARLIEAKSGIYRHSTQEFLASGVELSLFRLPGHKLPKESISDQESLLTGIAKDISFHFGGKTPQFQASQFQAMRVKE